VGGPAGADPGEPAAGEGQGVHAAGERGGDDGRADTQGGDRGLSESEAGGAAAPVSGREVGVGSGAVRAGVAFGAAPAG